MKATLLFCALVLAFAASCVPEEIPCFTGDNCPSETPFCVPGNICSATDPFADSDAGVSDVSLADGAED